MMTTAVSPQHDPATGRVVPPVGLHRLVSETVYHRHWEAASNSRLSQLLRSPAHLQAYLAEPPSDTPATRLGRAVHCAVLEPDDFEARYARQIEGDGRKKEIAEARAAQQLKYGPGNVIPGDGYDACLRIRDNIAAHRTARALLTGPGDFELSAVWDQDDVRCKARFDRLAPTIADGCIIDLKSTTDASPRTFERSIFNFGYHRQAALYLKAAEVLGVPAKHFVILAVEKEPPYAIAVYRLDREAVDAGWAQLQPLLARYRECTATGDWPAYPDEIRRIKLPPYAWAQIADPIDEEVA